MVDRAKDERFMRMALQEAKEAFDADEIPVGAVIVCKDRVVARAHNLTECLGDVTAHAEMQAITDRLYPVCDIGAVCDVCRRDRVGPARSGRIWSRR